jgi:tRNA (guanine-N7-)-methyltransferase
MRLRKKPGTEDKLTARDTLLVKNPEKHSGNWHEIFGNHHLVQLELGCGRGQFLTQLAKRHPELNFVAVECKGEVILQAIERAESLELNNIRFIHGNVRDLGTWFATGEVSQLYLNFSDPWPKRRHDKRRLTHRGFLETYARILDMDGWIAVKTDNRDLFEFTLNECFDLGLKLRGLSLDLHGIFRTGDHEGEKEVVLVTTEYEDKFTGLGMPIYTVEINLNALKSS